MYKLPTHPQQDELALLLGNSFRFVIAGLSFSVADSKFFFTAS